MSEITYILSALVDGQVVYHLNAETSSEIQDKLYKAEQAVEEKLCE